MFFVARYDGGGMSVVYKNILGGEVTCSNFTNVARRREFCSVNFSRDNGGDADELQREVVCYSEGVLGRP